MLPREKQGVVDPGLKVRSNLTLHQSSSTQTLKLGLRYYELASRRYIHPSFAYCCSYPRFPFLVNKFNWLLTSFDSDRICYWRERCGLIRSHHSVEIPDSFLSCRLNQDGQGLKFGTRALKKHSNSVDGVMFWGRLIQIQKWIVWLLPMAVWLEHRRSENAMYIL